MSGSGSMKVPKGARYVGRLVKILARKGSGSNWPNEDFQHDFKWDNEVYKISSVNGNPSGGVKIYDRLQKAILKDCTISFTHGKVYGKKNGNIVLTGDKGKFLVVSNKPLWDIFMYPE